MGHKRFQILDVSISAINLQMAGEIIDEFVKNGKGRYVCVAPVSTVVSCQEDKTYKEVVNTADMVTPDGMPTVWLAHWMGYRDVERTYGPDLMLRICGLGQVKGYRHYFLGATPETLTKLENTLKKKFPKLQVAGKNSPPFRPLSFEENSAIIEKINTAKPDLLWVGLGSPKQDFWMKENCAKLNVPVLLGVGAAFDFLSGVKPQAPRLLQKAGLEWLFRLCCEPQRLWKRYLVGNTKFVFLLIRSLLAHRTIRKA